MLGLPFAFASHFAPDLMQQAPEIYRATFKPSPSLEKPYVMLGLNVFAAETDDKARLLFSSLQQQFVNLWRGAPGPLAPPDGNAQNTWLPHEKFGMEQALTCSAVGSRETVKRDMQGFIEDTQADELMITTHMYHHAARLRSFQIVAQIRDELFKAQ